MSRIARPLLVPVLALAAGASCGKDGGTGPAGPPPSVTLTPQLDAAARRAAGTLADFDLGAESTRLVLRAGAETVLDTTVARATSQLELAISSPLARRLATETLTAELEVRHGSTPLFSGTGTVSAAENAGAASLVLRYVGPGADVAQVRIAERDARLTTGGTLAFTATATRANAQPVTLGPSRWMIIGDTAGTITPAGAFTAGSRRADARVVVMTPSGARDTVALRVLPPAERWVVVSGGTQEAPAGRALAQPVVLELRATDGLPLDGVEAVLAALTEGAAAAPGRDTTDVQGRIELHATLGRALGLQEFLVDGGGLAPFTVSATATVGFNTTIAADSGDAQQGTAGEAGTPLVVRVLDETGQPVSGATVAFAVATGGGTLAATTATTDAAGRARVGYTHATTAGAGSVTATLVTASGPVAATFAVTARAGSVARLVAIDSTTVADTVGQTLPAPLRVRAEDRHGNAVTGASVRWRVTAGSATVDTVMVATAGDGTAGRTLTLGTTIGAVTVRAAVMPADTIAASFTVTAVADSARIATMSGGDGTGGTVGMAFTPPPFVTLRDRYNNPVAGATVTFAVTAGGGSITGETVTSDATGRATLGSWTLGTATGVQTVRATVAGSGATRDFSAWPQAGAPHEVRIVAPYTAATMQYGSSFVVRVHDRYGNPMTQNTPITLQVIQGGGQVQTSYQYGSPVTGTLVNTQTANDGHTIYWNYTTTGVQRVRVWITGGTQDTVTHETYVVSSPTVVAVDTSVLSTWVPVTGDSAVVSARLRFMDAGNGIAGAGINITTSGSCDVRYEAGTAWGNSVTLRSADSGYFRVHLRHRAPSFQYVAELGASCQVMARFGNYTATTPLRAFFAPRGARRFWMGSASQVASGSLASWTDPAHWRDVATGAPGLPAANELLWIPAHAYGAAQAGGSLTVDSLIVEGNYTAAGYGGLSLPSGGVLHARRLLAGSVGATVVVVGAPDAAATLYAGSGYSNLVLGDASCAAGRIEVRPFTSENSMFNRDSTVIRCPVRMTNVSITAGDTPRSFPVFKVMGSGALDYNGGQIYIRGSGQFTGATSVINGTILLDGNLTVGPSALQGSGAYLTAQGGTAQTISVTGDGNVLPSLTVAPKSDFDLYTTTLTVTSSTARTFPLGGLSLQSRTGTNYYGQPAAGQGRLVLGSGVTLEATSSFSMAASTSATVNAGAALRVAATLSGSMFMGSGATISGGGAFTAAAGKGCATYSAQITTATKSCPQ